MPLRALTPLEVRVLGVLVEKQHTVPDSYPLSLNALVLGCNQKTARDPVMNATDADVLVAVDALKALSLVFEVAGSRVTRYEHNAGRGLAVPSQAVALLATLALRGPQTSAELRANAERLHRFADVSSVDGFLDELAARPDERGGALVLKLPRAPGAREARWTHLLEGPVDTAALTAAAAVTGDDGPAPVAAGELAALKAEQGRLRAELDTLRGELAALQGLVRRMAGDLGIDDGAA
jgi:uncharacterized protein YceH (UPF0502 family)